MPPPQMTPETTTPENSTLVIESQSNSIQTWDSILRQAIRIIAPRYRFQDGVVLAWKALTDSAVSESIEKSDARYLTFFLHAISRDNVLRAALAVKRLLNSKLNAYQPIISSNQVCRRQSRRAHSYQQMCWFVQASST
jgi:hypothetical protein